jgi:hypothetical protein
MNSALALWNTAPAEAAAGLQAPSQRQADQCRGDVVRVLLHELHEATAYAVAELIYAVRLPGLVRAVARGLAAMCPCDEAHA